MRHWSRVELLGQPHFTQPLKVMLVILGVLECRELPHRTGDREIGLHSQDLGRLYYCVACVSRGFSPGTALLLVRYRTKSFLRRSHNPRVWGCYLHSPSPAFV